MRSVISGSSQIRANCYDNNRQQKTTALILFYKINLVCLDLLRGSVDWQLPVTNNYKLFIVEVSMSQVHFERQFHFCCAHFYFISNNDYIQRRPRQNSRSSESDVPKSLKQVKEKLIASLLEMKSFLLWI